MVGDRFSLLIERSPQRGTFNSVDTLIEAIETWGEPWNDDPKPFVWTKTTDANSAGVHRAKAALAASVNAATDH